MKNKPLPNDVATLQALLRQQQEQNDFFKNAFEEQKKQNEQLQQKLDNLLRILYGQSSEKRPKKKADSSKKSDDDSDPHPPGNVENKEIKKKPKRQPLPEHLPRIREEYDIAEEDKTCSSCSKELKKIGIEVQELLDCAPVQFFVRQRVHFKYACSCGKCGVKMQPFPARVIQRGLATPGLLAKILMNKYQDALPLYRQQQRFERFGVTLSRVSLCDWVRQCANAFAPIVEKMKVDALLPAMKIHTDDTPVSVLTVDKGKTKVGRLWIYLNDGSDGPACTVYDYTSNRSQQGPINFLGHYRGFLQADAYNGYDKLYENGDIIEVGCWAHTRRKFFEIDKKTQSLGLANTALDFIGKLYEIERACKNMTYPQRYHFRKYYAKPILKCYRRWLLQQKNKVLPKTPIAQAIQYNLNHWRALNNYLADGRLSIDNNVAERSIRPIAIGRKNYLFFGSDEGGKWAAIIYSLIETCKQHAINPYDYFKDVLTRLPTQLNSRLHELLPYNWKVISAAAL
jgi:transposase